MQRTRPARSHDCDLARAGESRGKHNNSQGGGVARVRTVPHNHYNAAFTTRARQTRVISTPVLRRRTPRLRDMTSCGASCNCVTGTHSPTALQQRQTPAL